MANEDLEVRIGANIDDLIKELNKSKKELASFSQDVDKFSDKLKRTGDKMKSVGQSMSKYITLPLVGLGAIALKTAGDFEKLQTSLTTSFEGNAKAAKNAFDLITKFAANTPFQVEQVADAFIKLKNMGLDPSEAALKSYGNTASAMGKSLNQMVEAVADAATGEFERLKEFGIRASKQGDKVSFTFKGVTKTVKMESAAIEGYLQNIGNVDFAGGMEAQSKTFFGRLSTLKDNVSLLMRDFGDILLKYVNPIVDGFASLVMKFRELSPQTKQIIVLVSAFAAALGPLLIGLGVLTTTVLPAMLAGLSVLFSPITLIIAGIAALGVVAYKNFDAILDAVAKVYNSFVDLYNQSTLLRGIIATIGLAFKVVFIQAELQFKNIWAVIKGFGNNVLGLFKNLGKIIAGVLTFDTDAIKEGVKGLATTVGKGFGEITEEISQNGKEAGDKVAEAFNSAVNETIGGSLEKTTPEKLKQGLSDMAATVGDYAKGVGMQIGNALGLGIGGGEEAEEGSESGGGMVAGVKSQTAAVIEELSAFNQAANEIISGSIADTFGMLGDAIGNALATGGNVLQAAGNAILSGLSGLLGAMGDQLIKLGTAAVLAGTVVKLFGTISGIGAGLAAIAGGTLLKGVASALGTSANVSSGGYSGNTGSSGNVGANAPQTSSTNYGNSGSSSSSLQNVTFEIQGTKLVGVLSNTLNRNKSLSGTLSIN